MAETEKRLRTGERREQILAVALRLFGERGADSVSTRQIAEAVGISQPSLYAHFPSASAIADELCVRAFETLNQRFAERLDGIADPRARLELSGRIYVEFGLEHPDMYRIAFMPSRAQADRIMADKSMAVNWAEEDPTLAAGLRSFGTVRATIAEMSGAQGERLDVLAQTVWTAVHGVTSLLIAKPYFPWVERDVLIDQVIAMVLGMIARERGA